ncbi:MAG: pectate lyase [Proteobacteria bacterium]|nr:pectate lyase [Pseudomonadota bacterium]
MRPSMISRRRLLAASAALAGLAAAPALAQGPAAPADRITTLGAMKRATRFMLEEAAYKGGYVWSYLPDFSRRWGELEASPTMIWIQPPGTGTMGHLYLDAYHATGDEFYYRTAQSVAGALIAAQQPSGGWNYIHDFGGPQSLQRWYDTYGANAWRMEEFQHDWRNSTFDDAGTSEAMQFLLRIYLEKRDRRYRGPLDRAVKLVLDSQYPNGGWPQRYPSRAEFNKGGRPDYTSYVTFNDDVAGENIKFLVMVRQTLGPNRRIDDAIARAMNSFVALQQPMPQPAWGLQHDLQGRPVGARSYEPRAFATHTTAANLTQLMNFYQLTGDPKFLARIPEALDWLEKVKLPAPRNGRSHPTFIEIGTDRPIYVHRRGSNVVNGEYFWDYSPEKTLGHYSAFRQVNLAGLRQRYERLRAAPQGQVARNSPLRSTGFTPLPRYFALEDIETSDLNAGRSPEGPGREAGGQSAAQLIAGLNPQGYWPTPLVQTSNPYRGPGPKTPTPGDYASTYVGDAWDTSPYPATTPAIGISTAAFIQNMKVLIRHLDQLGPARG